MKYHIMPMWSKKCRKFPQKRRHIGLRHQHQLHIKYVAWTRTCRHRHEMMTHQYTTNSRKYIENRSVVSDTCAQHNTPLHLNSCSLAYNCFFLTFYTRVTCRFLNDHTRAWFLTSSKQTHTSVVYLRLREEGNFANCTILDSSHCFNHQEFY